MNKDTAQENTRPENWQRSEIDQWYLDEIQQLGDVEPLVSIKFLERYAKGEPIGNPSAFAWQTMYSCLDTTSQVAEALANDATAPTWYRCSAESILISLSRASKNINYNISTIRQLLIAETTNNHDRLEVILMITHTLSNNSIWRATKTDVRTALARIHSQMKVRIPMFPTTKHSCIAMAERLKDALHVRLSGSGAVTISVSYYNKNIGD